ncbi:hypothetical protein [Paraburkholderia humisilvae]|uniref:hypothetical protein n=1 Tax=Paraburkholderia humisilvae TaxID=627669 RepID=UPI00158267FC|nr:hypothetical protein [Paraburkholderia humisilvae]
MKNAFDATVRLAIARYRQSLMREAASHHMDWSTRASYRNDLSNEGRLNNIVKFRSIDQEGFLFGALIRSAIRPTAARTTVGELHAAHRHRF